MSAEEMSRCDATANGATTSKRRCAVDSPSRQSCCSSQHGAGLSFGRHRRDTSKSIPPTRLTTEVTARRNSGVKSDFCHKRRGPTRSEQPLAPELKPVAAVASVEVSVEIAIGVDLDRYIREEQAETITSPTEKCKQSQNEQTQQTSTQLQPYTRLASRTNAHSQLRPGAKSAQPRTDTDERRRSKTVSTCCLPAASVL